MPNQHFTGDLGTDVPESYERYFVPMIGRPLAGELLEVAQLQPGERVLDVACGTGIVTRLAAEAVAPDGSVSGLDVNPGMLSVARRVCPAEAEIEWHEASAEQMPLPDDAFDAVLCQLSLQFVPDRSRALREMRRVAVPGGRVALNVPGPISPLFETLAHALARHVAPEAGGFVRHVFSLHDVDEIAGLLDGAGFHDIQVEAEEKELTLPPPREFLWRYIGSTPIAGVVATVDGDARAALDQEVVIGWSDFTEAGGLRYRQRIVTATARA